ncbi:MAG: ATP-binding cassette domain-containing protein [Bryobacteraceae bacterium]|jgi:phospholipid/cholesterol/gamma-HCH transport system ATP-binding protein|nr:ATP-binding cassette domain-containing protein [Solibacteraceae bacterium]MCO5352802.1 ATP-binding cassette domain-containing protein [Bryobacteraceae bacterium]
MLDSSAPVVLAFHRVSLRFGDDTVLRDVSFAVRRGESMIVLGAAGSGKTVLLKTALGLLPATEGRIELFGEDVTGLDEHSWYDRRSRVGVLFQEGGLFDSLTIEENVAYPLLNQPRLACPEDEVARRVAESLRFVELGHTLDKFPSELSGGMRRRVGIARAIVTQPDLLLYDSPTAGLDPITANTIIALVIKGRDVRHATTFMVTHRYQDGQLLSGYRYEPGSGELHALNGGRATARTHYLVLREGTVVFDGSQEELEASPDPYVQRFVRREEGV